MIESNVDREYHDQEPKYYQIVSAWSCAGIGTSVVIKSCSIHKNNSFRLVLDIGSTPNFIDAIPAAHVLISHSHIDHIGAIFNHARAHSLVRSGSIPTYYVPKESEGRLRKALKTMSELDCNKALEGENDQSDSMIKMNIIGLEDGDEVQINKCAVNSSRKNDHSKESIFIRTFAVKHRNHPAIGFILTRKKQISNYDGKKGKELFKEKYRHLPGTEIKNLIKDGVDIKIPEVISTEEYLDFAYTGDTSIDGLLYSNNKALECSEGSMLCQNQIFQCPSLLIELTFLESNQKQRELACQRGHIHLEDIIPLLLKYDWFKNGACDIYFMHISSRYKPAVRMLNLIVELFCQKLSPETKTLSNDLVKLLRKGYVAIDAHLSREERKLEKFSEGGFINLLDWYNQRNK